MPRRSRGGPGDHWIGAGVDLAFAGAASAAGAAIRDGPNAARSGTHLSTEQAEASGQGHARAALETFDGLGARLWAGKTREELARIGGRAPWVSGLTPTEKSVASLAAKGMTNREIADHLFLTVRTVEWNLSKVYRKLQIRSRTELARSVRDD
jgi:DNA-binding NarL/FixJ family response regulator